MKSGELKLEKVENGYKLVVWKDKDENGDDMMYHEPKEFVSEDREEILKLVEKYLK